MASLDILCFNPFNLKNKIMKIEHPKIFRGPSKILKNISWPINRCLKYFMAPTKTLRSPCYILNVRSLICPLETLDPSACEYGYITGLYIVLFGKDLLISKKSFKFLQLGYTFYK